MIRNTLYPLALCIGLLLVLVRCSPEEVILPPSQLTYTVTRAEVTEGERVTSMVPTVQGTAPFMFALTSNPATPLITIDNRGVITAAETLAPGTYQVTVTVGNSAQQVSFPNVFTIQVNRRILPAAGLAYAPNTLEANFGTAVSSVAPTLQGTAPFTFAILASSTSNAQITINANTGVVTASATTPVGTYTLNISAQNPAGTIVFNGALTVNIRSGQQANLTTWRDVSASLVVCGNCHNYNTFTAARNNINAIINRVSRAPGSPGFMPRVGTALTAAQIAALQKWADDGLREQ
jgi:hypothetical protein